MDENSLIAALRKAETEKFAAVPSEEGIDHAFSDQFQQRMDRLIRLQRQSVWNMVKTPARRSLLLLMILLLTFGVPPEKNPLFRIAQPIPQLSTVTPVGMKTSVTSHPSDPAADEPIQRSGVKPHAAQTEPFTPEEPATVAPPETTTAPEEPATVPSATTRRSASAPETTTASTTEQNTGKDHQNGSDTFFSGLYSEALPKSDMPQWLQIPRISSVISQSVDGVITPLRPNKSGESYSDGQ